jgi:predicted Zn-dependent protease
MTGPAKSVGTLEQALAHAARLLDTNTAAFAEQATEILRSVVDHPVALWLLGAAQRRCGRTSEALELLAPLAAGEPGAAPIQFEYACALAEAGQAEAAINAWRKAVRIKPDFADEWRALADELSARAMADRSKPQLFLSG